MLRDPWLRALAVLGCAIAAFYLISLLWQVVQAFADIIMLFFLAWLIAFVLEPLVGTLVEIGKGKRPIGWAGEVLAGKDRTKAGQTAPPHGLYLVQVLYPP